jgi:excisionase family DNA binding protein
VVSAQQKIETQHLERLAVVYLRQSTPRQVREHFRSTERQYALAEEAARLGWQAKRVLVIDGDLGVSGRDTGPRESYKELVSRVCLGEVGAIFGLEVARLGRSSAEHHRLLEFCALTDTLIVDTDGVYDLQDFNDRMILGLKAQWSEAELHIMASRLQGARRHAAERGELRVPLPVGYVYDEEQQIVLDPDEEVRAAIADVFACFQQTGSAFTLVRAYRPRLFPARAYGGAWAGQLRWVPLTHSRALTVLQNPAYAGAYVFGRRRSRRAVEPDGTIRKRTTILPREQWGIVIYDHHPGYISWEQYLANEQRLKSNRSFQGARPVREGKALQQGIVRCGSCGRSMATSYTSEGRPIYDCKWSRVEQVATPGCQGVMGEVVERALTERLLAAVAPDQIQLALKAADTVTDRRSRQTRAVGLRVERARYDAARAERAFHQCDPDNRLVARTLEARWETNLRELQDAEAELAREATLPALPARADIEALARDLPRLWNAPTTSHRDRKRLLRALIADVTLTFQADSPNINLGIRWQSGASEQLTVLRPGAARLQRAQAVREIMRQLGPSHTAQQLAEHLNQAGYRTASDRPFTEDSVRWMRWRNQLPKPNPADGEIGVDELAKQLEVGNSVIYRWIKTGKLQARRIGQRKFAITFNDEIEAACRQRIADSIRIKPQTQQTVAGSAV